MNKDTVDKLKQNPHYRLSSKQMSEFREPMVEFGEIPKHPTEVPLHQVKIKRKKRISKSVLQ